jgi:hypothetical protein
MIFRADPSAVRFERGGRIGVFYVQVLETQGSIGTHLLCALQKNLRVFVYEDWPLPLKRWHMSAINELIMLTFLPPVSCLYTTRDGSTAEMVFAGNDG